MTWAYIFLPALYTSFNDPNQRELLVGTEVVTILLGQ